MFNEILRADLLTESADFQVAMRAAMRDFFPPHEQQQVRLSLAGSRRGVLCQRLMPRADGQGRFGALEIAINTGRISDAIADPISQLVAEGGFYWMQTFDQHLTALYRDGVITLEVRSSRARARTTCRWNCAGCGAAVLTQLQR